MTLIAPVPFDADSLTKRQPAYAVQMHRKGDPTDYVETKSWHATRKAADDEAKSWRAFYRTTPYTCSVQVFA